MGDAKQRQKVKQDGTAKRASDLEKSVVSGGKSSKSFDAPGVER
jgi:hypothetical protein